VVMDGDDGNPQPCLTFVVHLRQQKVNPSACIALICVGVDCTFYLLLTSHNQYYY